jgi:mono/diheme cytochrome c family protein
MRSKRVLLVAAVTTAVLGVAAAVVGAAVVLGGLYDVAATQQHWQPTYNLLQTAMQHSVKQRARDIVEPPLADEAMALRGAGCFRDKCVQCHGAPGVSPEEPGKSMQPLPGPLVDARRHWRPRELYWLTRHGIRMSGMPAWEFRLRDEELWELVAFMQRLPDLNAVQYADWSRRAPAAPACGAEALRAPATPVTVAAVAGERPGRAAPACLQCVPRDSGRHRRRRARRSAPEGHGSAAADRRDLAEHAGQHDALAHAHPAGQAGHGDAAARGAGTRRARHGGLPCHAALRPARSSLRRDHAAAGRAAGSRRSL